MLPLKLDIQTEEKSVRIKLSGSLNEYASDLEKLVVNPQFDLHLDLDGLQAVNSVGIRKFQKWIHHVASPRIRLFNCPRSFVHQMNVVDQFLPEHVEIESFYVPFFSENLGAEKVVLFEKQVHFKKSDGKVKLDVPAVLDAEGLPMSLDIFDTHYFKFLDIYK